MDFGKTLLLGWNEDNNFPELYSDYIELVYNRSKKPYKSL